MEANSENEAIEGGGLLRIFFPEYVFGGWREEVFWGIRVVEKQKK